MTSPLMHDYDFDNSCRPVQEDEDFDDDNISVGNRSMGSVRKNKLKGGKLYTKRTKSSSADKYTGSSASVSSGTESLAQRAASLLVLPKLKSSKKSAPVYARSPLDPLSLPPPQQSKSGKKLGGSSTSSRKGSKSPPPQRMGGMMGRSGHSKSMPVDNPEVSALRFEVSSVQKALKKAKRRIREQDQQEQQLREEMLSLMDSNESITMELASVRSKQGSIQESKEELLREVDDILDENDELKKKLAESEDRERRLREKEEEMVEERYWLAKQLLGENKVEGDADITDARLLVEAILKQHKNKVRKVAKERKNVEYKLEELAEEKDRREMALRHTVEEQDRMLQTLTEEVKTKEKKVRALRKEVRHHQEKAESLEEEKAATQQQLQESQEKLQQEAKRNDALRRDKRDLDARIDEMEELTNELYKFSAKLSSEKAAMKAELDTLSEFRQPRSYDGSGSDNKDREEEDVSEQEQHHHALERRQSQRRYSDGDISALTEVINAFEENEMKPTMERQRTQDTMTASEGSTVPVHPSAEQSGAVSGQGDDQIVLPPLRHISCAREQWKNRQQSIWAAFSNSVCDY